MSDLEPITREDIAWAEGNLEPVTRKEQYLNRLTGEEQDIPDEPITRTEQYLAKLCGEETEIPNSPITREELYLAYLNGEDVTLPEPITRLERFMAFAAGESETKPTPLTREEFYWNKYQGGAVLKDFPGLPASIVTVTDALAKPLNSLKVSITPVQSGSGDPSPDNIRPISGWTGADVNVCGKNLLYGAPVGGAEYYTDTGEIFSYPHIKVYPNIFVKSGTYTWSCEGSGTVWQPVYMRINELKLDGTWVRRITTTQLSGVNSEQITLDKDCLLQFAPNLSVTNIQFELGSMATSYEVAVKKDYSVPFTDGTDPLTVYGGTLDVVNGTLTVTKANIASYDGETLPGAWISDRDVYAEGTTPTTGAQVVYDLDTPITYHLTPTEIQMLLGTNNIWANTGDILKGKYYAKR